MFARFLDEEEALEQARIIGEKWGYGNCIQYLQYAWADSLIEKYPSVSRSTAAISAGITDPEEIEAYAKGFNVLKNPSTKGLQNAAQENNAQTSTVKPQNA
jgi:hypothetical protein